MNPPKLEDVHLIGFVILYALLLVIPTIGIIGIYKIKTTNGDEKMMFDIVKGLGALALLGVMYAMIMELLIPAIRKLDKKK
tara:strand:- start:3164 stop:3406 length:243 start_codon:yes stop_codon:yes gene_type:complete